MLDELKIESCCRTRIILNFEFRISNFEFETLNSQLSTLNSQLLSNQTIKQ